MAALVDYDVSSGDEDAAAAGPVPAAPASLAALALAVVAAPAVAPTVRACCRVARRVRRSPVGASPYDGHACSKRRWRAAAT